MIYRNKDSSGFWLELIGSGGVCKWVLKATASRRKTLGNYGYCVDDSDPTKPHRLCFPQDVRGTWLVSTGNGLKEQDTVRCRSGSTGGPTPGMKRVLAAKREEIQDLLHRPPKPVGWGSPAKFSYGFMDY